MYIYNKIDLILLRRADVSEKSCRENHIFHNLVIFFKTLCHLWDNVEKYSIWWHATDENV